MPTLTGPKNEGFQTRATEIDAVEKYSFAQKVNDRVSALGITAPGRPVLSEEHEGVLPGLQAGTYFDGRLPTVIRKLTLDQLSALQSLFSSWFSYLSFQTNTLAAMRSEALRKKEFMWSFIRDTIKRSPDPVTGKRPTDQSASDTARHDLRFVTACAEYEELNCTYEILNGMVEVAKQDLKVISREITIQQMILVDRLAGGGTNPMREALRRSVMEQSHADMANEAARDYGARPRPPPGGSIPEADGPSEPAQAHIPRGRPTIRR